MRDPNTFYITTPIYYVNDVPHIGHAYTTVAADVLARYWRLRGHDVMFLTGLDEHGQKVQQAAAKAGIDPQAHCDKLAPQFQDLWKRLNISNDAFIRTTDAPHKKVVQRLLQELYDKQLIYSDSYTAGTARSTNSSGPKRCRGRDLPGLQTSHRTTQRAQLFLQDGTVSRTAHRPH
jgi:methionyl-tRNA synthetase